MTQFHFMDTENEHRFAKLMSGFDLNSYLLGINCGFAEVVGAGCKLLALSSPLTEDQFKAIWAATEKLAEEYKVHLYVERDFISTILFDPDYTKDKLVIFFMKNPETLAEYQALKELKKTSEEAGTLKDVEQKIAQDLGHLLSYDDDKINQLLTK